MKCRWFPSPHPMGRGIKGEGFRSLADYAMRFTVFTILEILLV